MAPHFISVVTLLSLSQVLGNLSICSSSNYHNDIVWSKEKNKASGLLFWWTRAVWGNMPRAVTSLQHRSRMAPLDEVMLGHSLYNLFSHLRWRGGACFFHVWSFNPKPPGLRHYLNVDCLLLPCNSPFLWEISLDFFYFSPFSLEMQCWRVTCLTRAKLVRSL